MSKWWWKPKGKVPLYPTEAWVKVQIKNQLEQLSFWYFMPAASAYGKDGIPDFVVCSDGYFIGIEAKKLEGEWRAAQQDRAREIDKANGVYVVVDETGLMHLWNLLSQWAYNRVLPQGIHDFRRMKPEIQEVARA